MKTQRTHSSKRGFTLIELLVAMAITTIIVTVLVSITSIAIDTWNRSRSELRAARQAKAMIDSMARDFEALVVRSGNDSEWLSAEAANKGTDSPQESANASTIVFFTAATDRYDGAIGDASKDKGGDVSCVGYRLFYRDPISGSDDKFQTFVLNRYLVNPDEAFKSLLGVVKKATPLSNEFIKVAKLNDQANFVCENVYQFTLTFQIEVSKNVSKDPAKPDIKEFTIPVSMSSDKQSEQRVDSFRILGTGIESDVGNVQIGGTSITAAEIKAGRLASVGISLTVLSDSGVEALRKNSKLAEDAAWLAKNSFQYSKLIQLPGM